MNIKALITTLVLGTSSVALAAPTVRDHRTLPAPHAQPYRPAPRPTGYAYPVKLAAAQKVDGREVVRVSPSTRAFARLELRSISGRTKIDKVMITFANGGTQIVDCNKLLANGEIYSISLKGSPVARNVKSIVLVGSSGRRGALDLIAV